MVRQVEAVFRHGAFLPVEPLVLPEGTRVHLSVEVEEGTCAVIPKAKVHSPQLAHPEDAADFKMEVGETDNAGV